MGVDLGHLHAIQRVVSAWIIQAKAEAVDGVADIEVFGAEWYQVVDMRTPSLE